MVYLFFLNLIHIYASPIETMVRDIGTGHWNTCIITQNEKVKCWGANFNGQLGLGDNVNRGITQMQMGENLPEVNLGINITKVHSINMGYAHTCILLDQDNKRKLKCWGNNSYGQLGLGDTKMRGLLPNELANNLTEVLLGTNVTIHAVATGSNSTCAILSQKDEKKVKCWGNNAYGKLGQGDVKSRGLMANEMGDNLKEIDLGKNITDIKAITAGGNHTCALFKQESKAKLKCWGSNAYGELGLGDNQTRGDQANEMGDNLKEIDLGKNVSNIESVAAGTNYTCALITENDKRKIKCWGNNSYGQLGQGDVKPRGLMANEMGDNLKEINLGANVSPISMTLGNLHGCAVVLHENKRKIKCWGYNGYGQLGQGDTTNRGLNPSDLSENLPYIDTGLPFLKLIAGGWHTCTLQINNLPKCWGANFYGQLGLGSNLNVGITPNQMGKNLPFIELF